MPSMLEVIVGVLVLVLPVPSFLAVVYLWRLYLADTRRPRSWMLWTFALGSTGIFVAGLYFAALAVWRLLVALDLPADFRAISGLVIVGLLSIPIAFAGQIEWRRRLARKAHTEAPIHAPEPDDLPEATD